MKKNAPILHNNYNNNITGISTIRKSNQKRHEHLFTSTIR